MYKGSLRRTVVHGNLEMYRCHNVTIFLVSQPALASILNGLAVNYAGLHNELYRIMTTCLDVNRRLLMAADSALTRDGQLYFNESQESAGHLLFYTAPFAPETTSWNQTSSS